MIKRFENMDNKPVLKIKKEEVFIIYEYDYLDNFVKEVYGIDYGFCAENECNNDSYYFFNVTKPMYDYERKEYEQFKATGKPPRYFRGYKLFNFLAEDGLIERGKYLVRVSW